MRGLQAIRRVVGNRRILAAEFGFATYAMVLHGSWVAVMVYAFDQGGVAQAGIVSLVVLVPAALAGPFVAEWFDRFAPHLSLAGGLAAQGLAIGAVAFGIAGDLPSMAVYLLLALFSIVQMSTRPSISAILPRIVDDPAELAAANSATELIDTVGMVVGPALAGVLFLAVDGFAAPFFASAILLGAGTAAAFFVGSGESGIDEFDDPPPVESLVRSVIDGVAVLRQQAGARHLVYLVAATRIVVGVLDVAVVPLAIDQLDRSEAAAGFLGSAIGIGGVIGAGLSFLLVGRRRLTAPISAGLVLAALPVAIAASVDQFPVMLAVLVVSGIGRPILFVGARTLLQGLSADDTLARLFGLLEGLSLFAIAIGGAMFSGLSVAFGLTLALLVSGLLPIAILLVLLRSVRQIDAHRPEVDSELLALVKRVPIFAPLPPFTLEQVMHNMEPVSYANDVVVFAEGDAGDDFHVITSGSAIVELPGGDIERHVAGFYGEIALLRDQPRMATVRSGLDGLSVVSLERDVFLSAVSTARSSGHRANMVVERRLGERPGGD